MGKMMRSTPPPHGSHGGHPHSNMAPRHQSVGGGSGSYHGGNNYDGGEGRVHNPHQGPGVHHGGGYHQGPQHQPFQGPSQGRGSSAGPYYSRSQGPPGGYNSNKTTSAQQSESRLANGEERKVNRDSYDTKNSHGPPHSHGPMGSLPQREHGPKDQRKNYAGNARSRIFTLRGHNALVRNFHTIYI